MRPIQGIKLRFGPDNSHIHHVLIQSQCIHHVLIQSPCIQQENGEHCHHEPVIPTLTKAYMQILEKSAVFPINILCPHSLKSRGQGVVGKEDEMGKEEELEDMGKGI